MVRHEFRRETLLGRPRQSVFLAIPSCARCFSVAISSSIRSSSSPSRRSMSRVAPSVSSCKARRVSGSRTRTQRGDFDPGSGPGVDSTQPGAVSPLAGTGVARLHLAPKRAAHHMTAWISRTWKGRPTRLLTSAEAGKDASCRLFPRSPTILSAGSIRIAHLPPTLSLTYSYRIVRVRSASAAETNVAFLLQSTARPPS